MHTISKEIVHEGKKHKAKNKKQNQKNPNRTLMKCFFLDCQFKERKNKIKGVQNIKYICLKPGDVIYHLDTPQPPKLLFF